MGARKRAGHKGPFPGRKLVGVQILETLLLPEGPRGSSCPEGCGIDGGGYAVSLCPRGKILVREGKTPEFSSAPGEAKEVGLFLRHCGCLWPDLWGLQRWDDSLLKEAQDSKRPLARLPRNSCSRQFLARRPSSVEGKNPEACRSWW